MFRTLEVMTRRVICLLTARADRSWREVNTEDLWVQHRIDLSPWPVGPSLNVLNIPPVSPHWFYGKDLENYWLSDNLAMSSLSLPGEATTRPSPVHIARKGGQWVIRKRSSSVTSPGPHCSCFRFSRRRQRWAIIPHPLIVTCDNDCAFYCNKLKCPCLSF